LLYGHNNFYYKEDGKIADNPTAHDLIEPWVEPSKIAYKAVDQHGFPIPDAAPVKTLRDEFALAALTGVIAGSHHETWNNAAVRAYQLADAMLEARKK